MQHTHGVLSGTPTDASSTASIDDGPSLPIRRTFRRYEPLLFVYLAETAIYEMDRCGEFPLHFNLIPRCVVWELTEVEAWIEQ